MEAEVGCGGITICRWDTVEAVAGDEGCNGKGMVLYRSILKCLFCQIQQNHILNPRHKPSKACMQKVSRCHTKCESEESVACK